VCEHPRHNESWMKCFRCDEYICPECAEYAEYEHWPDGFFDRLVCKGHFKPGKGITQISGAEKEKFWKSWTKKPSWVKGSK